MTTDQQQEARWELEVGHTSDGTEYPAFYLDKRWQHPSDVLTILNRDHGQADVAEALRAENARLREAITAAMRYEHGEMDCLDESGKAVCRASAHRMFGLLQAALDAAPEGKQE